LLETHPRGALHKLDIHTDLLVQSASRNGKMLADDPHITTAP
jgi:hypothetical protein